MVLFGTLSLSKQQCYYIRGSKFGIHMGERHLIDICHERDERDEIKTGGRKENQI